MEYLTDELTFVSAAKNVDPPPYTSNGTLWQLGSGVNKNNPGPVHQIPNSPSDKGVVTFKGGILDETGDPTDGVVNKTRVFLGTVRFTAAGASIPADPDLTITYAEDFSTDPDSYKNFVQYNAGGGVVIDSADTTGVEFHQANVTSSPLDITERGDSDRNGIINILDSRVVRQIVLGSAPATVFADCNNDGSINILDSRCIRIKVLNP